MSIQQDMTVYSSKPSTFARFDERATNIKAVVSDVDGALLSSEHKLHPLTRQSVEEAVEAACSPEHPLQVFSLRLESKEGGIAQSGNGRTVGSVS